MLPSVTVNLLITVCAVAAVLGHAKKASLRKVLRYFTALSNLLCAAAALVVALCRLGGDLPYAAAVLKYVGTVTVSITFLTVVFFLGPTLGYKLMFSGPDLWLHLVCPALAIVSYALWDKPDMPLSAVLLGFLPVPIYGAVYIYRVLFAPETRRWKDFYGFNRGGKWPLSLSIMGLASLLISALLWLI